MHPLWKEIRVGLLRQQRTWRNSIPGQNATLRSWGGISLSLWDERLDLISTANGIIWEMILKYEIPIVLDSIFFVAYYLIDQRFHPSLNGFERDVPKVKIALL